MPLTSWKKRDRYMQWKRNFASVPFKDYRTSTLQNLNFGASASTFASQWSGMKTRVSSMLLHLAGAAKCHCLP
jgi:hypothetical protein